MTNVNTEDYTVTYNPASESKTKPDVMAERCSFLLKTIVQIARTYTMQDNRSTEYKDSTVQDPQQYIDDKLVCKHTTYRIYTDLHFLKKKFSMHS